MGSTSSVAHIAQPYVLQLLLCTKSSWPHYLGPPSPPLVRLLQDERSKALAHSRGQ